MNNILVFGAAGQLGQSVKQLAEKEKITGIIFPAEESADILDISKLTDLFQKHRPQFCVNCAAYTAVDRAEEEDKDTARKVNKNGPLNLARLCKEYGTTLIHISTDFVFEGNMPHLLTETEKANPVNIYGLTKLEGENEIISTSDRYYIIRTSWLYSEYGNNFVKTMLKLALERDELKVIFDQIGTPTYAADLAAAILHIIASGKDDYGIYHYSNEGVASWYDFTKAIFDIAGKEITVLPISTKEYPAKAARPAYTVMDKSKIKNTFGLTIPYWRDSLITCIKAL